MEAEGERNIEDLAIVESQRLVCENLLSERSAWRSISK